MALTVSKSVKKWPNGSHFKMDLPHLWFSEWKGATPFDLQSKLRFLEKKPAHKVPFYNRLRKAHQSLSNWNFLKIFLASRVYYLLKFYWYMSRTIFVSCYTRVFGTFFESKQASLIL